MGTFCEKDFSILIKYSYDSAGDDFDIYKDNSCPFQSGKRQLIPENDGDYGHQGRCYDSNPRVLVSILWIIL